MIAHKELAMHLNCKSKRQDTANFICGKELEIRCEEAGYSDGEFPRYCICNGNSFVVSSES